MGQEKVRAGGAGGWGRRGWEQDGMGQEEMGARGGEAGGVGQEAVGVVGGGAAGGLGAVCDAKGAV